MEAENRETRQESMEHRLKFETLKKFAMDNKIPIPPALETI